MPSINDLSGNHGCSTYESPSSGDPEPEVALHGFLVLNAARPEPGLGAMFLVPIAPKTDQHMAKIILKLILKSVSDTKKTALVNMSASQVERNIY